MKRTALPVVPLTAGLLLALVAGCAPAPQAAPQVTAGPEADTASPPEPITDIAGIQTDADASPFEQTSLEPDGVHTPPPDDGIHHPDVVFVPTPHEVVDEMLRVAGVGADDVLYDLGSGDGRIPITAAKRWGTRGVGIDIDPKRIREANQAAEEAGVTDAVEFIEADLFEADLADATVITLYLLPDLNLRLRPTLLELEPGTRIVSHNYHMGDWEPDRHSTVGHAQVYFWTVPETPPAHLRD
ncbi:MAG: SAM-dependent methyltransferase [Lysobacter sp.]